MKLSLALLPLLLAGAAAAQSNDFVYWPASKLHSFPAALKAQSATKKGGLAMEQLGNHGNFTFMVARRDQPGQPEVHANWSDIFIAQQGSAELIYGGRVEGGHEETPGEGRGGKIVGGKTQKLGPGDMVVIPAGMPHQTNAAAGGSFTYMIVKIEKK
ncbi:MAG TPA: AraC family ligand binding domain-containing protein [Bryobacterales bacterium]|nr:AraC family ligand binding domain-containing protein [Bryobacterales bacterium]